MKKNNKIVPFKASKIRCKSKYRLKSEITVHICRNSETYTCNCYCQNSEITEEEIFEILKKIFYKLSKEVCTIKIKKIDYYNITFTILYYENIYNSYNFKYLLIPQNMEKEKLTEYLYTLINIYELKKATK